MYAGQSEGQQEPDMYDASNSSLPQKQLELPAAPHSPLGPSIVCCWSLSTPSVNDGIAEDKWSFEHDFDSHVAEESVTIKDEYDPGLAGDKRSFEHDFDSHVAEEIVTIKDEYDPGLAGDKRSFEHDFDSHEAEGSETIKDEYDPGIAGDPLSLEHDFDSLVAEESVTIKEEFNPAIAGDSLAVDENVVTAKKKLLQATYRVLRKRRRAAPMEVRKISCNKCSRAFSLEYFKLLQLVNTGEDSFTCTLCSRSHTLTTSPSSNQKEIEDPRLKLTSSKPYKCELCSKQYKLVSRLLLHKLRHNGKTFIQSKILT